jgi:hypothetical protein
LIHKRKRGKKRGKETNIAIAFHVASGDEILNICDMEGKGFL